MRSIIICNFLKYSITNNYLLIIAISLISFISCEQKPSDQRYEVVNVEENNSKDTDSNESPVDSFLNNSSRSEPIQSQELNFN